MSVTEFNEIEIMTGSVRPEFLDLEGGDTWSMGELALLFVALKLPLYQMVENRANNIFGTFTRDMWQAFFYTYRTLRKWAAS